MNSSTSALLVYTSIVFLSSSALGRETKSSNPPKRPGVQLNAVKKSSVLPDNGTAATAKKTVPPAKRGASTSNTPPVSANQTPLSKPVVTGERKTGTIFDLFRRKKELAQAPIAQERVATKESAARKTNTPTLSQTAATATHKKEAPPLIPAPQEKKPGFLSRIFGGKSESKDTESAIPSENLPVRPADWEGKYVVKEDNVAGYAYGPSQARDADEYLKQGTIVSLRKGGKAWADITVEGGRTLTVGADQIRKAEITDFAAPVVAVAMTGSPAASSPEVYYEPAPPPNLPETSDSPSNLDLPELLLPPLPPQ